MRMHVDMDACTGHGVCTGIRPDIFELADYKVHLITEDFTEADRPDLEDAVNQCPAQALRIEG
jgi:ferredoxin